MVKFEHVLGLGKSTNIFSVYQFVYWVTPLWKYYKNGEQKKADSAQGFKTASISNQIFLNRGSRVSPEMNILFLPMTLNELSDLKKGITRRLYSSPYWYISMIDPQYLRFSIIDSCQSRRQIFPDRSKDKSSQSRQRNAVVWMRRPLRFLPRQNSSAQHFLFN